MATLNEMRQDAAEDLAKARAIVDLVEKEKRSQTTEEIENSKKHVADYRSKKEAIKAREDLEEEERQLAAKAFEAESKKKEAEKVEDSKKTNVISDDTRELLEFRARCSGDSSRINDSILEKRGLEMQQDIKGGFFRTPMTIVQGLLKDLDSEMVFRQDATVHTVANLQGIGVGVLDTDPADWTWTGELNTNLSEDDTTRFGFRAIEPHPAAKLVKISKDLMASSIIDFPALMNQRLLYKLDGTLETGYMTGTGNKSALGIFTADANGVPTSRDVATGNTATNVTFDGLKRAKYNLKQGYWADAKWYAEKTFALNCALIKDGDGRYMWRDSVVEGEPDILMGFPVVLSDFAPSTWTASLYVACLANLKRGYWILDSLQMTMQTLVELYALTNQIGLVARYYGDGAPVLPEAFSRVQLGT